MFQRSFANGFASISFVIARTCCRVVWNGSVCAWRIVTVGAFWQFHCIFPSPQWNLDITKGPRDLQNVPDKVRFCHIEVLFLTFCCYWGEEFCCINNFVIRQSFTIPRFHCLYVIHVQGSCGKYKYNILVWLMIIYY